MFLFDILTLFITNHVYIVRISDLGETLRLPLCEQRRTFHTRVRNYIHLRQKEGFPLLVPSLYSHSHLPDMRAEISEKILMTHRHLLCHGSADSFEIAFTLSGARRWRQDPDAEFENKKTLIGKIKNARGPGTQDTKGITSRHIIK